MVKKVIFILLSVIFLSGCEVQKQCERAIRKARINCPELFEVKTDTIYKFRTDTIRTIKIDTIIVYRSLRPIEIDSIIKYNDSIYKDLSSLEIRTEKDSIIISNLRRFLAHQKKNIYLLEQKLKNACKDLIIREKEKEIINNDSLILINKNESQIISKNSGPGFGWLEFLLGIILGSYLMFYIFKIRQK